MENTNKNQNTNKSRSQNRYENRSGILSQSLLFQGIAEKDIGSMLGCLSAREKTYKKNAYILSAGDSVTQVGIVLSGSVNVIKEDFWGNRAIIAKSAAGELFAEAFSCIDTDKLPISIVASENSEVLFIDYRKIITTCNSACTFHTLLINNMIKILANKNIMLMQKIEHTACRTTRDKLLSYLSAQAIQAQSNSFTIPFNRQELADYLSVDRSAMSNELSKLRDEGVLEFNKSRFDLHEKNHH